MEQVALGPPPLPPKTKTKKSPPASSATTTVLTTSSSPEDVFSFSVPEVCSESNTITSTNGSHVVKIRINQINSDKRNNNNICDVNVSPCIRISVNSDNDMIHNAMPESTNSSNAFYFYNPFNCGAVISSGQVSPSDTLDSGTCSDLDGTPPPLPKKKSSGISVTVIGAQHKRAASVASSAATDSDDNESNISCDSLNSADIHAELNSFNNNKSNTNTGSNTFLPQGLLQDIRQRSVKLSEMITKPLEETKRPSLIKECTYEERHQSSITTNKSYDSDCYYNFHLNENVIDNNDSETLHQNDEDSFAGFKDLLGDNGSSTIRSAKGTVRGVKNRVRAGIATFLQINDNTSKGYKEKDAGKVVVYTTTMGIVRETYNACTKVKKILRTLLIKYEERDVFMSTEYQAEIRDRMRCDHILVPQVFVDGQHIGDAEIIERLNESGELRRILKNYKTMDACNTCQTCGGFRLLPCPVCNGSKKSVHRNHFTTEFVALKCMNCDEVGLVKCSACS